jgi:hypothetical protein
MKQSNQQQIWGFRSLSFWLTLLAAVGIFVIGIWFFIDPIGRLRDFSLPIREGKAALVGYVKGIRDVFSGLIFFYLLAIRSRRITAVMFSMGHADPYGRLYYEHHRQWRRRLALDGTWHYGAVYGRDEHLTV